MTQYENIFDFAAEATSADTSENWPLVSTYAKTVDRDTGNTPLHYAAKYNPDTAILTNLLMYGANADARNKAGQTPLDVADTEEKKQILRSRMTSNKDCAMVVGCFIIVLIIILGLYFMFK